MPLAYEKSNQKKDFGAEKVIFTISKDEEKDVLNIVTRHYNSHPYLCPGMNMHQIQTNAV